VPATSAGAMNTSRVVDTVDTSAWVLGPMRTTALAGMAVPVTVTRVPPATPTRDGLIEVSPKSPTAG
jgi:hypothetical protein